MGHALAFLARPTVIGQLDLRAGRSAPALSRPSTYRRAQCTCVPLRSGVRRESSASATAFICWTELMIFTRSVIARRNGDLQPLNDLLAAEQHCIWNRGRCQTDSQSAGQKKKCGLDLMQPKFNFRSVENKQSSSSSS